VPCLAEGYRFYSLDGLARFAEDAVMRALFVAAIAWVGLVAHAAEPAARAVIDEGAKEILSALRDSTLSKARKATRVADEAEGRIDFEVMGRLSMGPAAWKEMTDGQRTEFLRLFRVHVLGIISGSTEEYTNEDVAVEPERPEGNGDRTVPARITGVKNGVPRNVARVEFRMRQTAGGGEWRVIDVTIEGISLAAGFRTQFQSVMKNGGVERLLEILREKHGKGER
jgi:phospholipid transport system substrate-binding protein